MAKRQREQVVELLRCAADVGRNSNEGLYSVAGYLDLGTWNTKNYKDPTVWCIACDARNAVFAKGLWCGYWHECLEAAARVEEGSWP